MNDSLFDKFNQEELEEEKQCEVVGAKATTFTYEQGAQGETMLVNDNGDFQEDHLPNHIE